MTTNTWLTSILNQTNLQQSLFEIISDKNKLNVEIQQIDSPEGSVHMDVLQFVSSFSVYQQLEEKRQQLVQQVNQTDDNELFAAFVKQLEQIENKQKNFTKNILLSAHTFSDIKHTETIQTVAEQFFLGNIEAAYQQLNPNELQSQQDKHLEYMKTQLELEKIYDGLEDNANEFRVKAQLTMLNYEIAEAEDRFQKTIFFFERGEQSARYTKRDAFISSYLFAYAQFLQEHKQNKSAIHIYKEVLDLYQHLAKFDSKNYLEEISSTLNNLGLLQYAVSEFTNAEESYERALGISLKLALNNPQAYLPDVALTLTNLADLYSDTKEIAKAEGNYLEALEIRRKLAKNNPQTYLRYVGDSLNNLGVFQCAKNEWEKGEKCFKEALIIRRKLAKINSQMYLTYVAQTLNNLGNLHNNKNEIIQAELSFQEALKIREKLAELNPHIYLRDVADSLINLANLKQKQNEWAKTKQAYQAYQEALSIYQKLAKTNSETYLPYIATTLNNLALLHNNNNEIKEAERFFEEALTIRRQLAKIPPEVYQQSKTSGLTSLVNWVKTKIQFAKENKPPQETSKIKYPPIEASSHLLRLGMTLNSLGALQHKKYELTKAEKSFKEALFIRRQLAENNSDTYSSYLAETLNSLANLQCDKKQWKKAEKAYQEALSIRRTLARDNPRIYLPPLSETLNNLGTLYADKRRLTKAEKAYQEALSIRRKLAQENSQVFLVDLASTLSNLVPIQGAKNQILQAEKTLEEVLAIRQSLSKDNPKIHLPDLTMTYSNMAMFYIYAKSNKEKSIDLAISCVESGRSFLHIPRIRQYISAAIQVLKSWQIDTEKLFKEKGWYDLLHFL